MNTQYYIYYSRKFILGILFLAFSSAIQGQINLNNLNTRNFTAKDGLPSSYVQHCVEDKNGFLWIATLGGIARFDGYRFENMNYLLGNNDLRIIKIVKDSKQRLWVCTFNGLHIISDTGIYHLAEIEKNAPFIVNNIYEVNSELVYIACSRSIISFNQKTNKIISQYHSKNIKYYDFFNLRNTMYCLSSAGIFKLQNGNPMEFLPNLNPLVGQRMHGKLILKQQNRIYFMSKNGIYVTDTFFNFIQHKFEGSFFYNAVEINGLICFTWEKGVSVLSYDLLQAPVSNNLPNDNSLNAYLDNKSTLWISTPSGLIRAQNNKFLNITTGEKFKLGSCFFLNHTFDHKVIIAHTYKGNLAVSYYYKGKIIPVNITAQLPLQKIFYIQQDKENNIWFIDDYGKLNFLKYSGNNYQLNKSNLSIPPDFYTAAYLCENGDFWLGGSKNIIKYNIYSKLVKNIANVPSYKELFYADMDESGRIWFCGETFGYCENNKFYPIHFPHSQNHLVINSFCFYQNHIYASTLGNGLVDLLVDSKNQIKIYRIIDDKTGLNNNSVLSCSVMDNGTIWAGTFGGLSQISMSTSEGQIQNFNQSDGILDNSWKEAFCLKIDAETILLGTDGGLVEIKQNNFMRNDSPPQVFITNVKLLIGTNQTNVATGNFNFYANQFQYKYSENSFQITYTSPELSGSSEVEFRYRLYGLENSWQSAGPNRQVTYSGLKPGNYIFQVQARKHHGNWSKNQAYFQFRINVPFWQTLWFILLIIFIVIALLIIIFYRRMMLIRNRAEQKFKIESQMAGLEMKALRAQMNPHFIFNALNSIQAFIVQDQADLALKYQNKFAKLLRQILENADKNLIPLSNELNALQIYIEIEALRLGEDFKYAIRIENNVDVEDCLIPPLILQPFVENSLWHGLSVLKSQKSLEISIARTEQNIICKIKDNGIGRKQAALNRASHPLPHNSKGLNVTEKRIELLHSDILFPVMFSDLMDANSAPLGTEVTITLPLIKRV